MKDEKFVYYQDVKEKKITSRSARNQRTHTGKGGRVKFPSDNLTQKELKAMSGEVKSYRLNEPMTWVEFKAMPDDLKVTYIKLLREKFNVADKTIGEMFGVSQRTISLYLCGLGCSSGNHSRGRCTKWDEAGWNRGVNGMAVLPEPVEEPTPEETGAYLVDLRYGKALLCFTVKDMPFVPAGSWYRVDDFGYPEVIRDKGIKSWMPLPSTEGVE